MRIKDGKNRAPITIFFLSTIYYGFCFFVFIFLINNVIIELVISGEVDLSKESCYNLSAISLVIGIASGVRIWFFTKLDEREALKTPPPNNE